MVFQINLRDKVFPARVLPVPSSQLSRLAEIRLSADKPLAFVGGAHVHIEVVFLSERLVAPWVGAGNLFARLGGRGSRVESLDMALQLALRGAAEVAEYAVRVLVADVFCKLGVCGEAGGLGGAFGSAHVAPEAEGAVEAVFVFAEGAGGVVACGALEVGGWVDEGAGEGS
ncbi:hypothetical protein V490_04843 [Pseudogymnoascus sp. VKM F-3557]|nr:hypothetical protein V490_04843 [Pseudogymnoascus sp. VKM F-3557]